jgi:hypothetical protein
MSTWAARAKAAISQKGQDGTAKTDETPVFGLSSVSSVPTGAVCQTPDRLLSVLAVPAPPVFENLDAVPAATEDPDRWCWPDSTAMNGTEIDLFTARLHRFTDKGLTRTDGEALADKLVIRDRETDDRRSCLECRHLSGYAHTSWRCGNWQAAGIAIRPRDTQLPADLVLQLQRCDGFATATPNAKTNATPNSIAKTPF